MFEMLLLLETFLVIRKYLFVGCIYYLYLSDSFIQNMTCYTTETEIHSLYFFSVNQPTWLFVVFKHTILYYWCWKWNIFHFIIQELYFSAFLNYHYLSIGLFIDSFGVCVCVCLPVSIFFSQCMFVACKCPFFEMNRIHWIFVLLVAIEFDHSHLFIHVLVGWFTTLLLLLLAKFIWGS